MGLLISADELADNPALLIFDCRAALLDKNAGQQAYDAAHIPGAIYANLDTDLSAPAGKGGRHPLPDREKLTAKLRAWGINRQSSIVCYDQNAGAFAGRLWWLLRWLGHDDVKVLDGGMDAWLAAGHRTSTKPAVVEPGDFDAGEPLTKTVQATSLPDPAIKLLDARETARYRGEVEPIDPVAGHIPGAVSVPFMDNLAAGQFRSPEQLRQRFESLGITEDDNLVCYCGSGVTATHNILALLMAGFEEPALYPGSWSEWIVDPDRPVASDS